MKTVSIIIPTYNEANTIDTILKRVFAVTLPGWQKQVIVVDDGSTDETQRILASWKKRVTVIISAKNQGKGSAVRQGITHANGDIILIQDADLEYNPEDYPTLLRPFENPQVTVVYGSRFLGAHLTGQFIYAIGNKFVTFISNILYNSNITDMETGYKLFRRNVLVPLTIQAKGFDFEPEITAKVLRAGARIYEVPISYYGRSFAEGKKITWRDGIHAVWTLCKYRFTPLP